MFGLFTKIKGVLKKHRFWVYVFITIVVIVIVALIEDYNVKVAQEPKFTVVEKTATQPTGNAGFFSPEKLEQSVIPGTTNIKEIRETLGDPANTTVKESGLVKNRYPFVHSVTGAIDVMAQPNGKVVYYNYSPITSKTEAEYIKTHSLGNPDLTIKPSGHDDSIIVKVYLTRGFVIKIGGIIGEEKIMEVGRFVPTDRDFFLDNYMTGSYTIVE